MSEDALADAIESIRYMKSSKAIADAFREEMDKRISVAMDKMVQEFPEALRRTHEDEYEAVKARAKKRFEHAEPLSFGESFERQIDRAKAEPRRNPYEDWPTWGNDAHPRLFKAQDMRRARFEAWNEGAQVTEQ